MKNTCEYREIVSFVTGQSLEDVAVLPASISSKQKKQIKTLYDRVSDGEPLAQVLGKVQFYGCELFITSGTLIPRPESELLVEKALSQMDISGHVLDLCCGSGCLGLAIKKAKPEMKVHLSDISSACIDIAQNNAKHNHLDVTCYTGDFLAPLQGFSFDYVICNPPYVTEAEYKNLDESVKNYEPKEALVGGEDGLFFYKKLANELPYYLFSGAKIFLEIGFQQGMDVLYLFNKAPWKEQRVEKDYSGHDRFFFASID